MSQFLQHGFGEFSAGTKHGPLQWPHYDLFFVHRGEVTVDVRGEARSRRLTAGHGILLWPSTEFTWQVEGVSPVRASVQHFLLPREFEGEWTTLSRKVNGFSPQRTPSSPQLLSDVSRAIDQAGADDGSPRCRRLREALLLLILDAGGFWEDDLAVRRSPRIDLSVAEQVVMRRLAIGCSVSDVAAVFELSASRFRSLFRAEHGFSVGAFIRRVRHRETQRLLVESRLPLKVVAQRVGLADTVVLGRTFRHDEGETPARYRLKNRILG